MVPQAGEIEPTLVEEIAAACARSGRPAGGGEILRALEPLAVQELDAVRRAAGGPLPGPVGPDALVDMARGTPPAVAAAREIAGYYALRAERDALADIARAAHAGAQPEKTPEAQTLPPEKAHPSSFILHPSSLTPAPPAKPALSLAQTERTQQLVTLFAYHRDGVRVAQELGVGLDELNAEIEALGLRRRLHRLLETTTDIDLFSPGRMAARKASAPAGPRRRRPAERPEKTEESPDTAPATLPPEEGPLADTRPVTPQGTRIWRRQPAPGSKPAEASDPLAGRREYVREKRGAPAHDKRKEAVRELPADARHDFSELQGSAGRLILERQFAEEKANPRVLAEKLGATHHGPAGRDIAESDLRALLAHHGLAESFREREIANTRFLVGFHQGAKAKLANALKLTAPELSAYLERLGLAEELDRVRSERARVELGRRKLGERIAQVLTRAPYLDDLGVLGVIDGDVREQVTRLLADQAPAAADAAELREKVRAELGMEPNPFAKLLRRYNLTDPAESLKPT